MKKRVLIVAANPAISSTTGWPVGFWASEVAHPYEVFKEAGFEVVIASPDGGKVEMDALSDPSHESGYSSWDEKSRKVLQDPSFRAALENTHPLSGLSTEEFDALLIAGGQAPMFNFAVQKGLHQFFADFHQTGKPTAALCHGTAILRYAKTKEGEYLVKGRKVTGFTNGEEDDADQAAGTKIMPWRIEDELKKLGADFQKAGNWQSFVVADGNLITGQQNMSGEMLAKEVIKHLKQEKKLQKA